MVCDNDGCVINNIIIICGGDLFARDKFNLENSQTKVLFIVDFGVFGNANNNHNAQIAHTLNYIAENIFK